MTKSTKEMESTSSRKSATEVKFKERTTPKIAFRSDDGDEVMFKKRKLNPDKKRNVRHTDPNKVN